MGGGVRYSPPLVSFHFSVRHRLRESHQRVNRQSAFLRKHGNQPLRLQWNKLHAYLGRSRYKRHRALSRLGRSNTRCTAFGPHLMLHLKRLYYCLGKRVRKFRNLLRFGRLSHGRPPCFRNPPRARVYFS